MQINKLHGDYNIVKRTQAVKYIVVHYVGAGSDGALKVSAQNNSGGFFFVGGWYRI